MPSTRNCLIGSFIAIVILVAGGVGIYFAVKSDGNGSTNGTHGNNSSKEQELLIIKFNDGTIKLYDGNNNHFIKTEAKNEDYGITSFGPYLNETIYYATTEPNSVIHSTSDTYPDLSEFTADWIKTAIAVDDVTKKVYVVDRLANQIKVVDGQYQYVLPLQLNEPKDVILVPENGTMFILEQAQIIMADMDGTKQKPVVAEDNIQAMAVDSYNTSLYFAHQGGIKSFNYSDKKARRVLNTAEKNVQSLTYKDMKLYFISKRGKSSKKIGTRLDVCHLDNSKCMNECCEISVIYSNEQLDQVKIYKSDKPKTRNSCETKNGDCEQLCFLNTSAEGRSCQCGNGWKLNPDNKTCVEVI